MKITTIFHLKTICIGACMGALLMTSCTEEAVRYKYTSDGSTTEYSDADGNYVLPVICHVFYTDKEDSTYIPAERISHIFSKVNEYYKKNNINVTFQLTTMPPTGKGIDYPGVEYIPWKSKEIDVNNVMGDDDSNAPYKAYIWDPNKYINVMFYTFKPEDESSEDITLGISHLPLTYEGDNELKGLQTIETTNKYLTLNNISWAPCSSINSKYAYKESNSEYYNPSDVTVTVAHELGHYLGLLHAFTEKGSEIADSCGNTDYCDDTPSYNRVEYLKELNKILASSSEKIYMEDVAKRNSCEVGAFESHNIMDYYMSFTDQLTADQKTRINNVLKYSPLVPRKVTTTKALPANDGTVLKLSAPIIREPSQPVWKIRIKK